jgi:hypothetical protein
MTQFQWYQDNHAGGISPPKFRNYSTKIYLNRRDLSLKRPHLRVNCAETHTWWSSLPIVLFPLGATPIHAGIERATMPIREGDNSRFNSCGERWLASSRHTRWVVIRFVLFFRPNVDPHPRWRRYKAELQYSHKKYMFTVIWNSFGLHVIRKLRTGAKMESHYFTTNILGPVEQKVFPTGGNPDAKRSTIHQDNSSIHRSRTTEQSIREHNMIRV